VAIWHDVGSVVTSALLLPLALSHFAPRLRFRPSAATAAMLVAAAVSLSWILARGTDGSYPLGLEPIFPALAASALLWLVGRTRGEAASGQGQPV